MTFFSSTEPQILLGVAAFILHLFAYGVYGHQIFKGNIRPNATSWFMWLAGGVIEYATYNALDGSHWSTSALPLACVIGIGGIFLVTLSVQIKEWVLKTNEMRTVYHRPEAADYYLTSFDLLAGLFWVLGGAAAYANILAVSTSIFTFIPIWRTTFKEGQEHPMPWIIWCIAYTLMLAAVLLETGTVFSAQAFYPIYYLVLHFTMVLLAHNASRLKLARVLKK